MISAGTLNRERGRCGREEDRNRDPGPERETDREEGSLFGMSNSEADSLCVCVCFLGHAASTVPLKVLFNNVDVPH